MARELTEKQRRFVEAYTGVSEGNATDAARRAGYGKPMQEGSRLLRNAVIAAALKSAQDAVRSAAIMDREERQQLLTSMARGKEPIPGGKTRLPSSKDRLKALETLCRMNGDLVDKQEHKHSGEVSLATRVFYPSNGRGPERGDG